MARRTYVGSHGEVVLPDGTTCKRGESIEVPDSIDIKELDESGNWKTPSSSTKEPKE